MLSKRIVAMVMALALLAAACSSGASNGWTDAQIDEMKTDCAADGIGETECQCMVDGLTAEFTYDEMRSEDVLTDAQAEKAFEITIECLGDLGG